jgi:pyruvate,orthophosphate dikinase
MSLKFLIVLHSLLSAEILGLKGGNLCEMVRIGLPVPPGFIVSSHCSLNYQKEKELSKALVDDMKAAVYKLESKTGKRFGGGPGDTRPLLLSVRSSAAVSMPGMMHTVLSLGINSNIAQVLAQQTNNGRWALMTHMKFLESFGTAVLGVDPAEYQREKQAVLDRQPAPLETLFSLEDLQDLIGKYKLMAAVPDDPWEQLAQCVEAAFKSWYSPRALKYRDVHSISGDLGAAVTVQAMVFGNINLLSGAGVVTTRNPTSGEKKLHGAYLANAEVSATCLTSALSACCLLYDRVICLLSLFSHLTACSGRRAGDARADADAAGGPAHRAARGVQPAGGRRAGHRAPLQGRPGKKRQCSSIAWPALGYDHV